MMSDPLGRAVVDHWQLENDNSIIVHSDICEDDEILSSYLFRTYKDMPKLEKMALDLCKGEVLDVGSAVGSHVLELQKKGLIATALEISTLCSDVMIDRGVEQVVTADFYQFGGQYFDTILLLMNGTGIAGSVDQLPKFFSKLKSMLKPNGQVLIDSSDLRYLFENEDGSIDIDLNANYYGEVNFQMQYKDVYGEWFKWLYLDKQSFAMYADMFGFKLEIVADGEHYDYLARLKVK